MLEEQFIEINVDIQNKKQLLEDVQDEIAAAKKNLNVTNLSRHWLRLITVFFFHRKSIRKYSRKWILSTF